MASTEETQLCDNCDKEIPTVTFMMHQLHCKRHLVKCPKCGEAVPKNGMEEHDEKEHKIVQCDLCEMDMEESELESHKKTFCNKRPLQCPYCELEYPYSDYADHEDQCGARTDVCDRCLSTVMLKDMLKHQSSQCAAFKTDQQRPHRPTNYASHSYPRSTLQAFAGYDADDASIMRQPRSVPHPLVRKVHNSEANRPSNAPLANKRDARSVDRGPTNLARGKQSPNSSPEGSKVLTSKSNNGTASSSPSTSKSSPTAKQRAPAKPVAASRTLGKQYSSEKPGISSTQQGSLVTKKPPASSSRHSLDSTFINNSAMSPLNVRGITPSPRVANVDSKSGGGDGSSSSKPHDSSDADKDTIPCEICDAKIPVEMFLDHQLHCGHGCPHDGYGRPGFESVPRPVLLPIPIVPYPLAYGLPSVLDNPNARNYPNLTRGQGNSSPHVYHDEDRNISERPAQHYRHPGVKPVSRASENFVSDDELRSYDLESRSQGNKINDYPPEGHSRERNPYEPGLRGQRYPNEYSNEQWMGGPRHLPDVASQGQGYPDEPGSRGQGYPYEPVFRSQGYPDDPRYRGQGYPDDPRYRGQGYPDEPGYRGQGYPDDPRFRGQGYPDDPGYSNQGYPDSTMPPAGNEQYAMVRSGGKVLMLKFVPADPPPVTDEVDEEFADCEHCEFPIPLQYLMRHELVCKKAPIQPLLPADNTNNQDPPTERTSLSNETGNRIQSMSIGEGDGPSNHRQAPITGSYNQGYDTSYAEDTQQYADDDLIIPCEYCHMEFPADILDQHQCVCKKNPGYDMQPTSLDEYAADYDREDKEESFDRDRGLSAETDNRFDSLAPDEDDDLQTLRQHSLTGSFNQDYETLKYVDPPLIPCDFCDEAFPADVVHSHEALCERNPDYKRPPPAHDEGSLGPEYSTHSFGADASREDSYFGDRRERNDPPSFRQDPITGSYNQGYDCNYADDTIKYDDPPLIPCEFCDEAFPADVVHVHGALCERNPAYKRPPSAHDEGSLGPEYTTRSFGADASREDSCYRDKRVRDDPSSRRQAPITGSFNQGYDTNYAENVQRFADDVPIPCDFCGDPFPADLHHGHEALCERNPDYKRPPPAHDEGSLGPEYTTRSFGADASREDSYYRDKRVRDDPSSRRQAPITGSFNQGYDTNYAENVQRFADDVPIPCDFCGDPFPADLHHGHEVLCEKNPAYKRLHDEDSLGPEYSTRSLGADGSREDSPDRNRGLEGVSSMHRKTGDK